MKKIYVQKCMCKISSFEIIKNFKGLLGYFAHKKKIFWKTNSFTIKPHKRFLQKILLKTFLFAKFEVFLDK